MGNPSWPSVIFRVFAVTNFLTAMLGGLFLATSVPSVVSGAVGNTAEEPYFLQFYWAMTAANVCFLVLLVLGGIYLLQLKKVGVIICNVVFASEILYFMIILPWTWMFSRAIDMSAAAATGVGNFGLSPQLISGYPIIGLVCLNLARRRRGFADRGVQAS